MGIVEINLIMLPDETILENNVRRYYCVCHLQNINSTLEMKLEKALVEKEEYLIVNNFNDIYYQAQEYRKYCFKPELIETLTQEEAKQIFDKIECDIKNILAITTNLADKIEGYNEVIF